MSEQDDILDGLEERLQNHAKAFESLLALTPAQDYYGSQIVDGKDPSDQWQAKKQTKEEKRAAKKAKLDPANQKSALDVMKERERKRKRELGMEASDDEGAVEDDVPEAKGGKRQKGEEDADAAEARRRQKAEKRKEKREVKKQKQAKLKEKREAKKAAKQDEDLDDAKAGKRRTQKAKSTAQSDEDDEDDDGEEAEAIDASEMGRLDMSGLADTDGEDAQSGAAVSAPSTAPSSPGLDSPAFDVSTNHSTASSSSSIIPPSVAESDRPTTAPKQKPQSKASTTAATQQKPLPELDIASATKALDPTSGTSSPRLNLPNIDSEALQERLRARLAELRTARKADGPDGKNPKSRQELLDQRRKKEEQRKAHKKELRRKAKEEESRKQEERLRGSGSPLSTDIFSPRPRDESTNNFSFSRLAFEDGSAPDASLTSLQDARKRKGPQDTRTALQAAEAKQQRLSGLDAEKRADIAEKNLWLNAKKRAHGERVRDDTSLLKKALKRQEKRKGKSAGEWKEREQAVVKGKEMKQKKREANLAKRKDEKKKGKPKGSGGGKGGKPGGGGGKKKGRPGFEGRFKA